MVPREERASITNVQMHVSKGRSEVHVILVALVFFIECLMSRNYQLSAFALPDVNQRLQSLIIN